MNKILIVDDEIKLRKEVRYILEEEGYAVDEAAEGHEALRKLSRDKFGVILLDIHLPGMSGIELIDKIRELDPDVPIIMISAYSNIENVVESVKSGAIDFIEKPYREERLLFAIRNILEKQVLTRKNKALAQDNKQLRKKISSGQKLIGDSQVMLDLRHKIKQAAEHDVTVLITGESGTGKELVAQAVFANCDRYGKKLQILNCASIQENLIESELFGYKKGAFTGANKDREGLFKSASGGTLFLDEIGDMSLPTQAKVLRAIESGRIQPVGADREEVVSVRLIVATNKNLEEEIKEKRFREDLYYRLDHFRIETPPLRAHAEDIRDMAEVFIKDFCYKHNIPLRRFDEAALDQLRQYYWPGNVREMKNVIIKLITQNAKETINSNEVQLILNKGGDVDQLFTGTSVSLKESTELFQRTLILKKLKEHDGNVTETARDLGENRSHFYRRLKKLNIEF